MPQGPARHFSRRFEPRGVVLAGVQLYAQQTRQSQLGTSHAARLSSLHRIRNAGGAFAPGPGGVRRLGPPAQMVRREQESILRPRMAAQSLEHFRKFGPQRCRIIFAPITTCKRRAASCTNLLLTFVGIQAQGFATKCNDKGRAPRPGACQPVKEVAIPHSDEALGETRWGQVGASSARNPSRMNGSRESRSSIRIAPVRSIPWRTGSKPKLRNGRTLRQQRGRTASRYFESRIPLCKLRSYLVGFPSSKRSFPCGTAQER